MASDSSARLLFAITFFVLGILFLFSGVESLVVGGWALFVMGQVWASSFVPGGSHE